MLGLHRILVMFSSLTITTGMYNVCNTLQSLDTDIMVGCLNYLILSMGKFLVS
jgi:hypothetical protein